MDMKKKVEHLVEKYNTNDPFLLCKHLGISVKFVPLGKILGFYSKTHRIPVIHINEQSPEGKRKFTAAHELAHALCHSNSNTSFMKSNTFFSTDKYEIEANLFAVELLFVQNSDTQIISLEEACDYYGVPKQLLLKNF
ncbi:ImmA/IrrE family metallo-endopeptidase [Oceanobacillus kimchii]|uniref:ImmA/IrrE family metallo-endopeptidase n=1 Tax=Oceanobacillus kimchii TaxID=746691 RepID=UPI003C792138